MMPDQKKPLRERTYIKWALTALMVIFVSILLAVIFSDLPGFFDVLKKLGSVLSPLVTGCVLAFLLNPLMRFCEDRLYPRFQAWYTRRGKDPMGARKLARGLSILFALIFAFLIVYAFFAMLLPQLYDSVLGIIENGEHYYTSLETWVNNILNDNPEVQGYISSAMDKGYELLDNWINDDLLSDMQKLLTTVTTSALAVLKWLTNLLIGLAASVYILWSKELFTAQAKKLVVATFRSKVADHLFYLGRETYKIFNGFVIGKIIDSAIIGLLCYIGMKILKLPFPALVATVVGITNVIPFFGPIIGAVPSGFLILLIDPLQAVYFLIFVLCLQQLDGNVIGPKILGNTIGISGFWVLVSITIAAGLFGFAGMLLGVPVFAVLYLLASDAVELALARKGVPTETKVYETIQTVGDLGENPVPEDAEEAESSGK